MTSDELWCWKEKTFQLTVKNEDLKNIEFHHTGFLLTILSTHSTSLQYKIEVIKETRSSEAKTSGKQQKESDFNILKVFDLLLDSLFSLLFNGWQCFSFGMQGTNKLCLDLPGVYLLNPVGCHIFASEQYVFDTSNPSIISIEAVRHLLSGVVISSVNVSDVKIAIKAVEEAVTAQNSNNNGEEAILGPISVCKC